MSLWAIDTLSVFWAFLGAAIVRNISTKMSDRGDAMGQESIRVR
jgi:hypothetical protein